VRRPSLATLVAVLSWVLAAGCSRAADSGPATPALDLATLRAEIEAKNARFTEAHITGDSATIDQMFTTDARVLPPGGEPVIGRAAIARLTQEYFDVGVSEFTEKTVDFYGSGDLLIDQGNYAMTYGEPKVLEVGKYLNVWKREDGEWRIYSNIWNTSPDLSTLPK
jgi:ketosteroid isomerase-like protein